MTFSPVRADLLIFASPTNEIKSPHVATSPNVHSTPAVKIYRNALIFLYGGSTFYSYFLAVFLPFLATDVAGYFRIKLVR